MRTTVKLDRLVDTVNRRIAYSATPEQRQALAGLIEEVLHEAESYAGFNYLPSERTRTGRLLADADDTRRFYYRPGGQTNGEGQSGSGPTSLIEAVRMVVQEERRSYPEATPHEAIQHVRDTLSTDSPPPIGAATIKPDGSYTSRAYLQVLEADAQALRLAVQARYGDRKYDSDVGS